MRGPPGRRCVVLQHPPGLQMREILMLVLSKRAHKKNVPAVSLSQFTQMVDRRLSISQKGLAEARQHLLAGHTKDAGIVLEKIEEDLLMLRCRLDIEVNMPAPRPNALHDSAN